MPRAVLLVLPVLLVLAVLRVLPVLARPLVARPWLRRVRECDILFAKMGKSAVEKLSRVCAILPASCLAAAAALLALAPLAARADEVMFRGQKIEYGGADLWNGRLARSISGRPRRLLF